MGIGNKGLCGNQKEGPLWDLKGRASVEKPERRASVEPRKKGLCGDYKEGPLWGIERRAPPAKLERRASDLSGEALESSRRGVTEVACS